MKTVDSLSDNKKINLIPAIILFFIAVRLVLSVFYITQFDIFGYDVWLDAISSEGILGMYNPSLEPQPVDYPPLFPILLSLVVTPFKSLLISHEITSVCFLYKIIPVIADIAVIVLLYKCFDQEAALLWAINPAAFVNSSMWAQTDVLFVLIMFIFLLCIYRKKTLPMGIVFAISVLTKPQGIYLFPVYIIYLVFSDDALATKIKSFACGLSFGLLAWLPFMIKQKDIFLPFKVYFGTSNLFQKFTNNCANIWVMLMDTDYPPFMGYVNYALLLGSMAFLYVIFRKRGDLIFATTVYLLTICMITLNQHDRYPIYAFSALLLVFLITRDVKFRSLYLTGAISLGIYELIMLLSADSYLMGGAADVIFAISPLICAVINIAIWIILLRESFKSHCKY